MRGECLEVGSIQRLSKKLGALQLIGFLCASSLVCAACAGAVDPSVDKVYASVEPVAYVGPCPISIKVTANITGTPSRVVTYRFTGDGFSWGPLHRSVIPPSGTLQVREMASIDAAHAGYFYRQVWIIVKGYRLDKYSNRALYNVTCAVPPPREFARTGNPKECGDHVEPRRAGVLCGATLANGQLVLVWNWKPDGCPSGPCRSRVDGYRVYQSLGKSHRLVVTQYDAALTVAALPQKAEALIGNCYTVRAFLGRAESIDSNELCVRPGYGQPLLHVVLTPARVMRLASGDIAVTFDLSRLSGAAVWESKLEVAIAHGRVQQERVCRTTVDLALADVPAWADKSPPAEAYRDAKPDANWFDATSAVRAWLQGTYSNHGFILHPIGNDAGDRRGCPPRDLVLAVDYLIL